MKISVQSLFEDYEENTVSLSRDADAERIWEKTRAKLPGLKKRRPVGLVLIAAAAVAVLCGAAAIVHYASVRDGAGSYIMPDTLRYDEENKKTILVDTPFEWNNPISFDTEGRTKGKVCGMRLGWLPEGWGTGYTQTAYDVIAQRDAEQAQSLPQDERELVVYTSTSLPCRTCGRTTACSVCPPTRSPGALPLRRYADGDHKAGDDRPLRRVVGRDTLAAFKSGLRRAGGVDHADASAVRPGEALRRHYQRRLGRCGTDRGESGDCGDLR